MLETRQDAEPGAYIYLGELLRLPVVLDIFFLFASLVATSRCRCRCFKLGPENPQAECASSIGLAKGRARRRD